MALGPVPSSGRALMVCWMPGSLPNRHANAWKGMSFSLKWWPVFTLSQAVCSAQPSSEKHLLYPSLTTPEMKFSILSVSHVLSFWRVFCQNHSPPTFLLL